MVLIFRKKFYSPEVQGTLGDCYQALVELPNGITCSVLKGSVIHTGAPLLLEYLEWENSKGKAKNWKFTGPIKYLTIKDVFAKIRFAARRPKE